MTSTSVDGCPVELQQYAVGAIASTSVMIAFTEVYGMTFEHMPKLHWRVGYPFAVALMVAAGLRCTDRVGRLNPTSPSGSEG